jgi:molybdate transport system substrate-binding protein
MPTLKILSGGAAQGLVNALAPGFQADTGCVIAGEFGAVGTMAAKLRSGEPADLLILTAGLIDELAHEGYVAAGSSTDIGVVHTAIAIRDGDKAPPIDDPSALRAALLASDAIYFPDPRHATAGIHFARVLDSLGISHATAPRLRAFPNGATAMRELAASASERPIGCTQVTEILNTPGVALVGPLPRGCELATIYTAAVCTRAHSPAAANEFKILLTRNSSDEARRRAGFGAASSINPR